MREVQVAVVGGCGHVGLPLAVAFAGAGLVTVSYDRDPKAVAKVMSGKMPFAEPDGDRRLAAALEAGLFEASSDPSAVQGAKYVVVVIGTPVDEHLNPDAAAVPGALADLRPYLRHDQLIVLRSTVYPGVTRLVEEQLAKLGVEAEVAFCPERIAEGKAFEELYSLPQIVSGRTPSAIARARELFAHLTDEIVEATPEEAELAKLFTNAWRYIKFAAVNQFYMMANDFDVDFENVRRAITYKYPRAADMPSAGFAAGPCLFKDTMQLAAFNNNNFVLGHSSMLVNEGLPAYLVSRVESHYKLRALTVGILGMAFKAESDDTRSSLSYKLRRILAFKAAAVLCHDPYVANDSRLVSLAEVLERSDLIIIGAPHQMYQSLDTDKPVIDIWNVTGNGVLI